VLVVVIAFYVGVILAVFRIFRIHRDLQALRSAVQALTTCLARPAGLPTP
jgi:hypothetical protein